MTRRDVLGERDSVVTLLYREMRGGTASLSNVPGLLKRVIAEEAWRERKVEVLGGRVVRFERFAEFLAEQPPEGLGADAALLRRILSNDPEALDLLDRALQGRPGNPNRDEETGRLAPTDDNVNNRRVSPAGNARDTALRRLRKDRPDLHAQVLAGEMSPHGAMVEAGFRRRTVTVALDVDRAARVIAKAFTRDEVLRLIAALQSETRDA